jgi:hypothetical protein
MGFVYLPFKQQNTHNQKMYFSWFQINSGALSSAHPRGISTEILFVGICTVAAGHIEILNAGNHLPRWKYRQMDQSW